MRGACSRIPFDERLWHVSEMYCTRPKKTGILLINLGTPDAPDPGPVRRYLREFLGDPRVIDLPRVPRSLLLNLIILPTRPRKSAAAYRKIWTPEGSPLLLHARGLQDAIRRELGDGYQVELGMRYGSPSLASALKKLRDGGVEQIVLAPLYPQYSASATGSALARAMELACASWDVPFLGSLPPFYDDPRFIDASVAVAGPMLQEFQPDHVLFSYHGLPERQVQKSDPSGSHCLRDADCCAEITDANHGCYRAHCFATTASLAEALRLDADRYSLAFQSRMGRTPWIEPHTDARLPELANAGVKRLAVACPAFVADCLETLEEIGIRAKEQWLELGGEDLLLVPSLNTHPAWVKALASMLRDCTLRQSSTEG